ncbi:MAG: hypothetical protein RBU37_27640 [Myxococcota bacterium]|jgi:hypothetical protein|nr:hypothetical protein [Myxococcota bacterium]
MNKKPRQKAPAKRHQQRREASRIALLCSTFLLLAVACAESSPTPWKDLSETAETDTEDGQSDADLSQPDQQDADTELSPDQAELDESDEDEQASGPIEVCVVNGEGPNGACDPAGYLNWTLAPLGQTTIRYVRLKNPEIAVEYQGFELEDEDFSVRVLSFSGGEQELTLPVQVEPDSMTFFELSYHNVGHIPLSDHFVVLSSVEEQARIEIGMAFASSSSCELGMGDCDNDGVCETDLRLSLFHCGGCQQVCSIQNAEGGCEQGVCTFLACQENFIDLDQNTNNGCEYYCKFETELDLPDAAFLDANCDGVDGDLSQAVFVAPDGNDLALGTEDSPVQTINTGIQKALDRDLTQVYVSMGVYDETVILADGVSVFGSFSRSAGWKRAESYLTSIAPTTLVNGRMLGMRGMDLVTPTYVSGFSILPGDTTQPGASNYGLHCLRCSGLVVTGNVITAGRAGSGLKGQDGSTGSPGSNGGTGGGGSCNGDSPGAGGSGGSSPAGRTGGVGGVGGKEGEHNGATGGTGQINIAGGAGGAWGDPGKTGAQGNTGPNGSDGLCGQGGAAGSVIDGYWVGTDGLVGGTGEPGHGGGGGGGGGAQSCLLCNDGSGNGGGGGGGGGAGGNGGRGGGAGGGSFGLFLIDSTGIEVSENRIRSGQGGDGGGGGLGGGGGDGGSGGNGGNSCTGEVGPGGRGGNGGRGGTGGAGGGGAGGPSYGIYKVNTELYSFTNDFEPGSSGNGGGSIGGGACTGSRGSAAPSN